MRQSAGLILFRRRDGALEVLLVHPGGPFWARKDAGAWSIPKGEYSGDEAAEAAARREFTEETGTPPPAGPLLPLGAIVQRGGKRVTAFAAEGDLDPAAIRSNTVVIPWPPRSGRTLEVPEIDRGAWFGLAEAREKILPAQAPLLERLEAAVGVV